MGERTSAATPPRPGEAAARSAITLLLFQARFRAKPFSSSLAEATQLEGSVRSAYQKHIFIKAVPVPSPLVIPDAKRCFKDALAPAAR